MKQRIISVKVSEAKVMLWFISLRSLGISVSSPLLLLLYGLLRSWLQTCSSSESGKGIYRTRLLLLLSHILLGGILLGLLLSHSKLSEWILWLCLGLSLRLWLSKVEVHLLLSWLVWDLALNLRCWVSVEATKCSHRIKLLWSWGIRNLVWSSHGLATSCKDIIETRNRLIHILILSIDLHGCSVEYIH